MNDLSKNQLFYVYLVFSVSFFLLLLFTIRSTILVIRAKEYQSRKISIHICILIATGLCIATDTSIVIYVNQPIFTLYCLFNISNVMIWFFLFSAYLLVLESWISIYQAVSVRARRHLRKLRVAFIVCDTILFAMLATAGSLYCSETVDNSDADQHFLPGDYFYVISIVTTALIICALLAIYGFKVTRKLREGMKIRVATDSDRHIYLVTLRVSIISTTSAVGALLAIIFAVIVEEIPIAHTVAQIIQMFFEILLMLEILFVSKPQSSKWANTKPQVRMPKIPPSVSGESITSGLINSPAQPLV